MWVCTCTLRVGGGLQHMYGRNVLNGHNCVCVCWGVWADSSDNSSCFGESEVERLPECMSEAAEGGGIVRVWAPLGKKVGQASFIQGWGKCSDLQRTHSHLVAAAQGQNVHCLLPLLCSKPLLLHLLNHTHRSEEIHSTYTPSPETTTQQTLRFLHRFTHSFPYHSLERIVAHSHCFFLWSLNSTVFCSPSCLLISIIFSQVEPRLTPWTRELSNQSSAAEVLGKTEKEKGGRIKEVKEKKEAHRLPFFSQQASLLVSPPVCPPIPPPLSSHFSPSELSAHPSPTLPRW